MNKLAVQMYTIRDFTKTEKDLVQSLEKIAAIGYRAVQLSAVGAMDGEAPAVDAARARKLLDDHGLACVATHRSWDRLAGATEAEIGFHKTLGCDFAAIGGLPRPYEQDGGDGYRRFVEDSAPVIARLKAAGLRFGYHNHAHEYRRVGEDSRKNCYDLFVERGGPDFLLEIDVYWAWHGGVDPSALMARSAGRVPVIHLKDKEVVAGEGPVIAAIGEGNLPWETIIPACEAAGVDWYCIEQDTCPRDPFDCLRSSFVYLSENFGLT